MYKTYKQYKHKNVTLTIIIIDKIIILMFMELTLTKNWRSQPLSTMKAGHESFEISIDTSYAIRSETSAISAFRSCLMYVH